jgi:hypothetical protein
MTSYILHNVVAAHSPGEVQVSVHKETVVWKRGLLVVPNIVHQLLDTMQVFACPQMVTVEEYCCCCSSSSNDIK